MDGFQPYCWILDFLLVLDICGGSVMIGGMAYLFGGEGEL